MARLFTPEREPVIQLLDLDMGAARRLKDQMKHTVVDRIGGEVEFWDDHGQECAPLGLFAKHRHPSNGRKYMLRTTEKQIASCLVMVS